MKYISSVIYGVVVLLLLIWLPAIELIRRTIMPWRERRKRELEDGVQRRIVVQVGPFQIIDEPLDRASENQQPKEPSNDDAP